MTRDEAIDLLRGPFGKVIRDTVTSYVAPLCWEALEDDGRIVLRNGTVFFLDAGQGPFAVTASHVYQGYLEAKDKYPQAICQLWNMRFDPVARLIAHQCDPQSEPDIATFHITSDEIRRLGKVILTGQQTSWPPLPPKEGTGAFFAGFPGQDREQFVPNEVNFGVLQGFLLATSVTDRTIVYRPDHCMLCGGRSAH